MNKRKRFLLIGLILMILVSGTSCQAVNDKRKALSYTPTPEFWEEFDKKGIRMSKELISVIVPCYNESDALPHFFSELDKAPFFTASSSLFAKPIIKRSSYTLYST